MNGILKGIFRTVLPAMLLMASALVADAWAKDAQKTAQYSPDPSKANVIEYATETVVIPYRWTTDNITSHLVRAYFNYQKKPDSTCSSKSVWADFAIQTDIAPCLELEEEDYEFVRYTMVDGAKARFYRAKEDRGETTGILPGGSLMKLTVNRNKRCYIMSFNTCKKWIPRFFPDFMLIINNFKSYKKASEKPNANPEANQAGTGQAEGSAFVP